MQTIHDGNYLLEFSALVEFCAGLNLLYIQSNIFVCSKQSI
jgi:hypothetical protein